MIIESPLRVPAECRLPGFTVRCLLRFEQNIETEVWTILTTFVTPPWIEVVPGNKCVLHCIDVAGEMIILQHETNSEGDKEVKAIIHQKYISDRLREALDMQR